MTSLALYRAAIASTVERTVEGLDENNDGVLAFVLTTRERIVPFEPGAARPAASAP